MRRPRGMTVLELMIVMAIVAIGLYFASSGLRRVTKADLTDDTLDLASVLRRAGQLAIETGQLHRVVLDFDKRIYAVEACRGANTLVRGKQEPRVADPREAQDKIAMAQERLSTALPGTAPVQGAAPDDAVRRAAALAGHHVLDRVCEPAAETPAPGAKAMSVRELRSGVKLREVWVQHLDDSTTDGTVAIHFFPFGSAEKAVVEVVGGDDVYTILIHGLSGRVEVKDEALRNADDHMLRDAIGEKEEER
jgi:prepilin-type N-terminal cleavage/methylation domain-containing protein